MAAESPAVGGRRLVMVPVDRIVPSAFQPRRVFEETALKELADSIRRSGVMQPVVVRIAKNGTPFIDSTNIGQSINGGGSVVHAQVIHTNNVETSIVGGGSDAGRVYELIAGERRWRAARLAGLDGVPAVVVDISDQEAAEWGIIENVQRADLNPIEKARAFKRLSAQFGLTHAQIAERVGMDRVHVTQHMGLLELPEEIVTLVHRGDLSFAHARALMIPALRSMGSQIALGVCAANEGWSLRHLDAMIQQALAQPQARPQELAGDGVRQAAYQKRIVELEKKLGEALGTKVKISGPAAKHPGEKSGRIIVKFFSVEQFQGLIERLGVSE